MSENENPDSSFIADSVGPGLVVGLWLFGIVYSVLKVGGAAAWVKVKNREYSQARGRREMFEGFRTSGAHASSLPDSSSGQEQLRSFPVY